MKRALKVATMLTVYLVWICGTAAIALSCFANNLEGHSHCCASCECHHEGCEKSHLEAPHACNHDHSNTIAFYDTAKQNTLNIAPVELSIAAQIEDNLHIEEVAGIRALHYLKRKIPLPPAPTLLQRGMRAPPVVA